MLSFLHTERNGKRGLRLKGENPTKNKNDAQKLNNNEGSFSESLTKDESDDEFDYICLFLLC